MADITLESTGYYKVDPLYQWDLNQTLYIYGVSVVRPVIHFNNKSMVSSIVRQPSIDKAGVISVKIPNSLLQKPEPISVFVCGYEGDAFKTYYKMEIPVKARKKPADYTLELDDEEVFSFVKLEQTITDALVSYEAKYKDATDRVSNCEKIVDKCESGFDKLTEFVNDKVYNVHPIEKGGTGANTADEARANLGAMSEAVLVWENASPDSEFVSQTVSIDLSAYRYIIVEYNVGHVRANGPARSYFYSKVGTDTVPYVRAVDDWYEFVMYWRVFTIYSYGFAVNSGQNSTIPKSSSTTAVTSVLNTNIVPIAVWGIK